MQINRKTKELNGRQYVDPWDVGVTFGLQENAALGTVTLSNTLYDGQLVNKAYVENFDVLVV